MFHKTKGFNFVAVQVINFISDDASGVKSMNSLAPEHWWYLLKLLEISESIKIAQDTPSPARLAPPHPAVRGRGAVSRGGLALLVLYTHMDKCWCDQSFPSSAVTDPK